MVFKNQSKNFKSLGKQLLWLLLMSIREWKYVLSVFSSTSVVNAEEKNIGTLRGGYTMALKLRFSKVPKLFGWHNSLCIFKTNVLFPLQHMKRQALQKKQVRVLRMAFRARKVLGSFSRNARLGPVSRKFCQWLASKKTVSFSVMFLFKTLKYINFWHSQNVDVRKPNGMARDISSEPLYCSLSSDFF